MDIKKILAKTPILPVITINKIEQVLPLANALLAGGIRVLEITLRTPVALEAISLLRKEIPECIIGAGTITKTEQFSQTLSAGAVFAISPALSVNLIKAAKAADMPYLPGVATPSEVLLAQQQGLNELKFFPAHATGGIPMLKSLAAVFPTVQFCPTGGINSENFNDYLNLSNVFCVGGSWLTPQNLIEQGNWNKITTLTQQILEERRHVSNTI